MTLQNTEISQIAQIVILLSMQFIEATSSL